MTIGDEQGEVALKELANSWALMQTADKF